MTAPPYEWPTRMAGLLTRASVRLVAATSAACESRPYWTAITWWPSAWSVGISLLKHEPSAQIPWQKTMLGLVCVGFILFSFGQRLLTGYRGCGSLFDELGCFLRVRHVGHMAGIHFDRLGMGALRHHTLLVRIDRPVCGGHHIPSGLGLPGGRRDLVGERVGGDGHLRLGHEVGHGWRNVRREVGREMLLLYPPVAVAVWLERLRGLRQGLFDRRTALTVIERKGG